MEMLLSIDRHSRRGEREEEEQRRLMSTTTKAGARWHVKCGHQRRFFRCSASTCNSCHSRGGVVDAALVRFDGGSMR